MALQFTKANSCATDDEEEDSSSVPSSPVNKPIARRSKFDDEEDDSDVRQPTIPRAAQLVPRLAQKSLVLTVDTGARVMGRRRGLGSRAREGEEDRRGQGES
jgi:translation initiation factor 3 subunit J